MPNKSETTNENKEKGMVERESSWTEQIKDRFVSGRKSRRNGNSIIYSNGISISNWQEHPLQKNEKKYHLSERTQINTASTLY